MADEPIVEPGEPTLKEPVQEPKDTEPQVQDPKEPGELDVLKKQLSNLEEKLGTQGNELGQLRNENAYFRDQQGRVVQQTQYPPNPETGNPAGNTEEYDPYDPKSVERYHAAERKKTMDQINATMTNFAAYQQKSQIGAAFNRGKQTIQQNPEYFKGYENETINMVSNLANSGTIHPDLLENPTTWFGVLDMVKGEKTRQGKTQVNPVTATTTEMPLSIKSADVEREDAGAPDMDDIAIAFYGKDKKKAMEAERKEAKKRKARGGM